jgi:hypothetical protein
VRCDLPGFCVVDRPDAQPLQQLCLLALQLEQPGTAQQSNKSASAR